MSKEHDAVQAMEMIRDILYLENGEHNPDKEWSNDEIELVAEVVNEHFTNRSDRK